MRSLCLPRCRCWWGARRRAACCAAAGTRAKSGLGQVVFISGEAGIGKSALVEALRAQVRAEGLPRIAFRCSPYHTNSALYPVITHIEHLLQFESGDAPGTRLAKLEAGLRPSGLLLAEAVPLVAGLLSVPLPTERWRKDGRSWRRPCRRD